MAEIKTFADLRREEDSRFKKLKQFPDCPEKEICESDLRSLEGKLRPLLRGGDPPEMVELDKTVLEALETYRKSYKVLQDKYPKI